MVPGILPVALEAMPESFILLLRISTSVSAFKHLSQQLLYSDSTAKYCRQYCCCAECYTPHGSMKTFVILRSPMLSDVASKGCESCCVTHQRTTTQVTSLKPAAGSLPSQRIYV